MTGDRSHALAHAARRVRALVERLPEPDRPDIVSEWGELLDSLEDASDTRALPLIADWLAEMEQRLAPTPEVAA